MEHVSLTRRTSSPPCSRCHGDLNIQTDLGYTTRCKKCNNILRLLNCSTNGCKFQRKYCVDFCPLNFKENRPTPPKNNIKSFTQISVLVIIVSLVVGYFIFVNMDENVDESRLLKELQNLYPSQRKDTWYHFLSVLENTTPSVKSITFLHGEDKKTLECLINKLVSLFSGNKTIRVEEITGSEVGFEKMDYGLVLEHYLAVLKKFRVFITDLTEVSGKFARIFHSLCDEISSDVKPSLFIFTIKFKERTENLKPLKRATTILQKTWSDLPESELFPLLSRVIKNVVEIVPEMTCS